jgi:hypothetical protein
MKIRRMICNSGPASQFTLINQFIALRPRSARKHTYPPTARQHLFWRPDVDFQLTDTYLQALPRHNGIGSLPSATTTAWSARKAELPDREVLVEIALYSPASATTVSRISSTLFIGGVSLTHTSARGEVYAESMLRKQQGLWITVVF